MTVTPSQQLLPEVLVVDDELGMREGMRRVLVSRGYRCEVAPSGEEALRLVQGRPRGFGMVLVDLKMPGLDGFELISRLRALDASLMCIVVSAFATIQSAVRSTRMGAFDFVAKPFEPDELMVVINRAAEQWRLAGEAERLRAEREAHLLELSAEKSRLRTILHAMGEGLLVVNVNGDVVLDNAATRRFLGTSATRPETPLAKLLPDPRFLAQVETLLRGETDAEVVELELCAPAQGTAPVAPAPGVAPEAPAQAPGTATLSTPPVTPPRYLRATLAPVGDESGGVLGVVIVLADITDDKALERAKTLFISMVAHEIKAPIGAVEGYIHLIRDGSYDGEPDEMRQVLDRCLERIGALLALVQDLLELTRRDAGRLERRLEPLDLASLTSDLVEFHAQAAERRRVTVTLEAAPGLPPVVIDRNDVERILTNLLSNAIKYNRDDGRVRVRLTLDGDEIVIEVTDTGIGMSQGERARLGEEFFRAKNPRTRSITGTGLGVALVKKIVEGCNGRLEVESVEGEGSTFRVRLPAGQRPTAVEAAAAPATEALR